jgi:broad specificity phosphatase PhoE
VREFEDAYDAAGIVHDCVLPADLLRASLNVDIFFASDLPRAVSSAHRLAQQRDVVTSPLLREIRLEPPRWIPLRLPIAAWDVLSHLQWSYRLVVGADHDSVRRAEAAADWLEQHARCSTTLLVVTHGGFRRILAARFIARRWQLAPGRASYANWSSWEFERSIPRRTL